MFEKFLAVKTAITQTKSADADSGKSRVSVTCVGRFRDFRADKLPVHPVSTALNLPVLRVERGRSGLPAR
jgi:hypothetical protein